jgi:hypothetical protein
MKPIKGYEKYYLISGDGKVFSKRRKKILKLRKNRGGYFYLNLYGDNGKKSKTVHRLVAKNFIPNPLNKPCINHKDGNKINNSIKNLEWCTYSENTKHAYKIGNMRADGKYNGRYKEKNI